LSALSSFLSRCTSRVWGFSEVLRAVILGGVGWTIAFFLFPLAFSTVSQGKIQLEIDADISAGTNLEVYFNSDWWHPSSARVKPAERARYTLTYDKPPFTTLSSLGHLRIDITDSPRSVVKLYGVSIREGEKTLLSLTGSEVSAQAGISGIANDGTSGDAWTLSATSNDPFISFTPKVELGRQGFLGDAVKLLNQNLLRTVLVGSLIIISIVGIFTGQRLLKDRLLWAVLPHIFLFGIPAIVIGVGGFHEYVPQQFQDVSLSVGNAVFAGYSKHTEYLQIYFCLGLAVLTTTVLTVMGRIITDPSQGSSESAQKVGSYALWLGSIGSIVVLLWFLVSPYVAQNFASLRASAEVLDYDSVNIETWNYLFQSGALPFRDYWFPYGFSSFTMGRSPAAAALEHLHKTLLLFVAGWSLFFLFNRRFWWSAVVVAVLAILDIRGEIRGTARYLLALDLVLFFGAVAFLSRRMIANLLFGIFGAYAFIYEPSQCLYALPGLIVIAVVAACCAYKGEGLRPYLFRTGVSGVTGMFLLAAFFLLLWSRGQLEGFVRVYSRLGSSATSSSIVANIPNWLTMYGGAESTVLMGSIVLVAVPLFFMLMPSSARSTLAVATTSFAVGLVSVAIFLKHLVRPHMAVQFIGITLVGGVMLLYLFRTAWSRKQVATLYVSAGVLLYAVGTASLLSDLETRLVRGSEYLSEELTMQELDSTQVLDSYKYYFSKERLARAYPVVGHLVTVLDDVAAEIGRKPEFYVLGDEAFLYNAFDVKPPAFITFYNLSDVRDQHDVVAWLQKTNPEIVVWNTDQLSFDGVPNNVRVPLIFRYVFNNYRVFKEIGGFSFLRRTEPFTVDLEPLLRRLGDRVDLGGIPALSAIGSAPVCDPLSPPDICRPILRITSKAAPQGPSMVSIPVEIGERTFAVMLRTIEGKSEYVIRLDRLWFWSDGDVSRMKVKDSEVPGFVVSLEGRVVSDFVLY
jgi:hypothetical protein